MNFVYIVSFLLAFPLTLSAAESVRGRQSSPSRSNQSEVGCALASGGRMALAAI